MEKPTIHARFCLLFLIFCACPASGANPYLHLDSGEPVVSRWSGSEWGDEIGVSDEGGRPLAATVTSRRLAKMSWGQIVRMRFEVDGERKIRPVYLLVRDEVILELVSDDMEYLVGAIAGMVKPPHFDPQDVRGSSRDGEGKAVDGSGEATVTTADGLSTYLWSHPSGHFRKFVWARDQGVVEYAAGTGSLQDGFRLFPAGPEGILDTEKLGDLSLGMSDGEVVKMLGAPAKSSKVIHVGATGEWMIDRSWPDQGLSLSMYSEKETGPWKLGTISAKAPCRLATAKGIRVGSFAADVAKAYAKEHSADDSVAGECFVAGSIYGGVIFDLREGVVTRIFMGAAAE